MNFAIYIYINTKSQMRLVSESILGFLLLASERSERDTYRGNTIDNRGCLFVYIYVWTYVRHFCTLTLAFLC